MNIYIGTGERGVDGGRDGVYEEKDSEHEDEVINVVMMFLMMMSKAKTFVLFFNYCSN